jgi:tRNA nucleotidyltransferase (CCA-adding enzyme)
METVEQASIPTIVLPEGVPVPKNNISDDGSGTPLAISIQLDQDERNLLKILRETLASHERSEIHFSGEPNDASVKKLELRVAGGWVRDKILGYSTHDVDIAVNNITGVQMAELVRNYLEIHGTHTKIGVIAANPAQSKHLETATMKISNIDVDFCNLRSAKEIYGTHSRIPELQTFGTPAEDAARRDFTINALFFNINTETLEDWTGRGIRDLLQHKVLVTPIDPRITFVEDPLRVLRAIRFAVRYNFRLDDSIAQTAMLPEIHHALHIKVSRERVGKELEGMLTGKTARPISALETIAKLKLAGSVFCVPVMGVDCAEIRGTIGDTFDYTNLFHDSDSARHIREWGWEESRTYLSFLAQVQHAHQTAIARVVTSVPAKTTVDLRMLPLAVFLLPFRKLVCIEKLKINDGGGPNKAVPKQFSACGFMFKEGIKFKGKDVRAIETLMNTVDRVADFLEKMCTQSGGTVCRLEAGLWVRETKDLWVTALLLATVVKLRKQQQQQQEQQQQQQQNELTERSKNPIFDPVVSVDWIQVCNAAYSKILTLGLDECWKMRPLLDGKEVIKTLDLPRGPEIGEYLEAQMRWMLMHPDGNVDECKQHLLSLHKRKRDEEHSSVETENNTEVQDVVGMSDGTGLTPSSPVSSKKTIQHFSKKMHVERMDTT